MAFNCHSFTRFLLIHIILVVGLWVLENAIDMPVVIDDVLLVISLERSSQVQEDPLQLLDLQWTQITVHLVLVFINLDILLFISLIQENVIIPIEFLIHLIEVGIMVSSDISRDTFNLVLEFIARCFERRIDANIPFVLLLVVKELLHEHGRLEEEEFDWLLVEYTVGSDSSEISAHQIIPIDQF